MAVRRVAILFVAGAASAAGTASAGSCPEAVIDGTVGSGSSDHPFTTGNQVSRLFRDSQESNCGEQKATPNLTDVGTNFKYDAYTFSNSSPLPRCITVITTPAANGQLFTAAYRSTFNPANVQQNYLGDAGDSDGTHGFSFLVPAFQSFVVVQSRVNNAATPPSLGYSFRVLGIQGCNSCPPPIILGSTPTGSEEWPARIAKQTGRLFRDSVASVCDPPKPVPNVTDPAIQFDYNSYTFLNPSISAVCVTVNTTAGANNQIFTSAYLDGFEDVDVQENYVGDAGNSDQLRSFSFVVPPKRSFVVTQGRVNNAGNPTSLDYFFSVAGLPGCIACPVIAVSPADIPNAIEGRPYSEQLIRTGGAESGTWSVVGGELPAGLSLSASGLLSGTPTELGNFSFRARFNAIDDCLGEKIFFFSVVEDLEIFSDGFETGAIVGWNVGF